MFHSCDIMTEYFHGAQPLIIWCFDLYVDAMNLLCDLVGCCGQLWNCVPCFCLDEETDLGGRTAVHYCHGTSGKENSNGAV